MSREANPEIGEVRIFGRPFPGGPRRDPGSGSSGGGTDSGTFALDIHYVAPVTMPDERADNSARNAALKTVNEALKSGRIVQADHDMRVAQVNGAQTMQDIDLVVRDLRAPGPAAPPTIAPMTPTPTGQQSAAGQPWPLVNYGPGAGGAAGVTNVATAVGKGGGKAIGGIIAAIIVVAVVVPIAGAVIAFFSARDSFPDFGSIGPTDDTTYLPGQAPGKDGVNVHTVDGYTEMVDALHDETDAAYVFSAVLYPRYAVLEVPTGTNNRYQNFYWNGEELELQDIKGTTDDGQVDLSLVDAQLMIDCLNTVRGRLGEPRELVRHHRELVRFRASDELLREQRLQ